MTRKTKRSILTRANGAHILRTATAETRTPDLHRVNLSVLAFSTTYQTAGTAKVRGSRERYQILWAGLWVGFDLIRSRAPAVRYPRWAGAAPAAPGTRDNAPKTP